MKVFYLISLILEFLFISSFKTNAQVPCYFDIGERVRLLKSANLYQLPDNNSPVLANLNEHNSPHIYIVDSIDHNNYLNVTLKVDESYMNSSLIVLQNLNGWIRFDLLASLYDAGLTGTDISIEYYNSNISRLLQQKQSNSCQYSDDALSFNFQQRGIKHFESEEYFQAIQDITKSLNLSRESCLTHSYYYRAVSKKALSDFNGAILDFDSAAYYCSIKNMNLSCECLNCVKEIYHNDPNSFCIEELFTQRALCKASLKKYQSSLIDLNRAIEKNNNYGYAYFIRGQIKDMLNDKTGCCLDLSKAGQLGVEEAYEQIQQRCK